MVKRSFNSNALERFKAYVKGQKIEVAIISEAINYAIRVAQRGISCALVVKTAEDISVVNSYLQKSLNDKSIELLSQGSGGFLLKNNCTIRAFANNTREYIHILMTQPYEIVNVGDGDPVIKKTREVFDL